MESKIFLYKEPAKPPVLMVTSNELNTKACVACFFASAQGRLGLSCLPSTSERFPRVVTKVQQGRKETGPVTPKDADAMVNSRDKRCVMLRGEDVIITPSK